MNMKLIRMLVVPAVMTVALVTFDDEHEGLKVQSHDDNEMMAFMHAMQDWLLENKKIISIYFQVSVWECVLNIV